MMVFFVGWRDFVLGPPLIINHQKTSKTVVNSPSHQQHLTNSIFVTFCEAKNHVPRSHWWQHPGCDHPRGLRRALAAETPIMLALFDCDLALNGKKSKLVVKGGHGESEPRSVGVLANARGMTLLLQRTKAQEPQLSMCFAVASRVKIFWSPSGTLCPKARGLSPQHIWERTPCVSAAWPCFPCPPNCQTTRWEIFPHKILTNPMTLNSLTWPQCFQFKRKCIHVHTVPSKLEIVEPIAK